MILADLEAIKRRCEAATPGPWDDLWFGTANYGCRADVPWPRRPPSGLWRRGISVAAEDDVSVSYTTSAPFTAPDAEFIANAREDVPALLEAVERLLSMLTDAQTEAEMQAAEVGRLRVCAEWARRTIDEEWPDGPTGDTENWRRFVAVLDRGEGDPPELWEP